MCPPAEPAALAPAPSRGQLLRTCLVVGATSFGGGLNAFVRQVFVVQKHWVSEEDFLETLEISQLLPGPNMINLVVGLAHRLSGRVGAALALFGLVAPAIAANVLLAATVLQADGSPAVAGALIGFGAAAVGLSLANVIQMSAYHVRHLSEVVLAAMTVLAVGVLRLNLLLAILLFGALGIVLARRRIGDEAP